MARELTRSAPVVFALLLTRCAASPETRGYTFGAELHGDPRIGQYLSSDFSHGTASYWIEGERELLIIDTQLAPSATRKAHDFAERHSGKKATLAVVLGAAPDRFDGTAFLQSVGARVVTSAQVRAALPAVHARWAPTLFERFHVAQYSKALVLPEAFGDSTTALSFDGMELKAHVLGRGSSPAHVVLAWDGHLFTGDLVSRSHSWFDGGDLEEWLKRLEELRAMHPRFVHPGRGLSGGPELIDEQARYLMSVRDQIAAAHPAAELTDSRLAELREAIQARNPSRTHPELLPGLIRAEWRRQVE